MEKAEKERDMNLETTELAKMQSPQTLLPNTGSRAQLAGGSGVVTVHTANDWVYNSAPTVAALLSLGLPRVVRRSFTERRLSPLIPRFVLEPATTDSLAEPCLQEVDFVGAFRAEDAPMSVLRRCWISFVVATLVCAIYPRTAGAADEPTLTKDQIKNFLLTAKVVDSKPAKKGITNTWRLTLSDGTVTHDASFQSVDEHKATVQLAAGTEVGFVDSYKYNIAAYQLAEMLGIDDLLPVYVDRKWKGDPGSLSWWLPVMMDEEERVKRKVEVPDPDTWDKQMYKIRVLDQLVQDSDPNLTNVLIGKDWTLWRIDFTRAFRLHKELKDPDANLVKCDRQLLEKLKALDANTLTERTKHYLNKDEVKAVMARRDKIVEHFQRLIAAKGENAVLY